MQQTVRPDGKITMPLIGDVNANDITPKALTAVITDKLKEFINNPNVMVTVEQVRSKKFTITGEVNRPGSYPLLAATTVLDALTNAGGFRDFANKKKISIIRGGERLRFNYNEVIEGKNMEQNITLMNGDLIVVP
jgi:polysaccharide export outer membrane protein